MSKKTQASKEAKIERQAFEEVFGVDRECYDKIINSPKCTKTTPAPSPNKENGGESPPSPEFEEDLTPLIISEPVEDQNKVIKTLKQKLKPYKDKD